jgi:DNA-binding transcriptional LysR family regulator
MAFDNLDDLRVLLATADTGSLTAAGRRCGLSTAAVSAAMKRLEATLGARLFDRTTRSVRPTAEGEVMIDHARRALDLVAEGQAKVRGEQAELVGTINVTASSAMSERLLAGWLGEFAAAHPGLEIDLQVSDSWLDLVKDGVDVALRNGPLPDSSLAARLLAPAHRQAFASPAFLERHGEPQHPADCAGASWAAGASARATVPSHWTCRCGAAWPATTPPSRCSGRARGAAWSTCPRSTCTSRCAAARCAGCSLASMARLRRCTPCCPAHASRRTG